MKIKTVTSKLIAFTLLSEDIQQEILPDSIANNCLFWAKVPSTVDELTESPFWADFCKQQDFRSGEFILIEVTLKNVDETKKSKKIHGKRQRLTR
jgi:hypothetical protein